MPTSDYFIGEDSNNVKITMVPEVTWGAYPVLPSKHFLRCESESFGISNSRIRPNEIDPSGQSSSAITSKIESTGGVNIALASTPENWLLIAASMGSNWSGEIIRTATTPGHFTITRDDSKNVWRMEWTNGNFFHPSIRVAWGQTIVLHLQDHQPMYALVLFANITILTLRHIAGYCPDSYSAQVGDYIKSFGVFCCDCGIDFFDIVGDTCRVSIYDTSQARFDGSNPSMKMVEGSWVCWLFDSYPLHVVGRVKTVVSQTDILMDCVSGIPSGVSTLEGYVPVMTGAYITNGKEVTTFSVSKEFTNFLSMEYYGCFVNSGSVSISANDYAKGSFSFMNKSQQVIGQALPTNQYVSYIGGACTPNNSLSQVRRHLDNSSGYRTDLVSGVVKFDLKWSREGAASQYGMGSAAAVGMRSGKFLVTGTLSMYFNSFDEYQNYTSETASSYSLLVGNLDAFNSQSSPNIESPLEGYIFTILGAVPMNPKIVAGGPGQDVMVDFELEGNPIESPIGYKSLQIDCFPKSYIEMI